MFNLNLPTQHLKNLKKEDKREGEAEGLRWQEAAQPSEESSAGFKSCTDLMKASNYRALFNVSGPEVIGTGVSEQSFDIPALMNHWSYKFYWHYRNCFGRIWSRRRIYQQLWRKKMILWSFA